MKRKSSLSKATKRPVMSAAFAAGALALALPSAGLAVVGLESTAPSFTGASSAIFTPSSVDPQLAARVAAKLESKGLRFTPTRSVSSNGERMVTVAVRVDSGTAQAISVRNAIEAVPSATENLAAIQTKYNLGVARGYQSFARPVTLPDNVRNLSLPDLAAFEPAGPTAQDKPSRLQPRIALEEQEVAGRSRNTLDALKAQTVDLGGAYSLSRNLNVTAGVRLSQERDRLAPLTDSAQDSQAVYVGTQLRF